MIDIKNNFFMFNLPLFLSPHHSPIFIVCAQREYVRTAAAHNKNNTVAFILFILLASLFISLDRYGTSVHHFFPDAKARAASTRLFVFIRDETFVPSALPPLAHARRPHSAAVAAFGTAPRRRKPYRSADALFAGILHKPCGAKAQTAKH